MNKEQPFKLWQLSRCGFRSINISNKFLALRSHIFYQFGSYLRRNCLYLHENFHPRCIFGRCALGLLVSMNTGHSSAVRGLFYRLLPPWSSQRIRIFGHVSPINFGGPDSPMGYCGPSGSRYSRLLIKCSLPRGAPLSKYFFGRTPYTQHHEIWPKN